KNNHVEFRITTNESVNAVIAIRDSNGEWIQGAAMQSGTENVANPMATFATAYRYGFSSAGLKDDTYSYEIQLTDRAGNSATTSGTFTVDNSPPEIGSFSVFPLVLTGSNGYQASVVAQVAPNNGRDADRGSGYLKVTNASGEIIATQAVTVADGRIQAALNGTNWGKGAYHVELVLVDSVGNSSVSGMDVVKDGMGPTVLYPPNKEFVSSITAIKGQVMDPDFANAYRMKKYRLLFKEGSVSMARPDDLTGFEEHASVAWVPSRLRSGTEKETEGTQEVRAVDTIGYLNPGSPRLKGDTTYTFAIAVEEEGLGVTAVKTFEVYVIKPESGAEISETGVGQLEVTPIARRYSETATGVPIEFRVVNGIANVNVDIVNMATQKVVANRRYQQIAGSEYLGTPNSKPVAPGVYISKNPSTSVWTVAVKSDGSQQTFHLDFVLQGDAGFTDISKPAAGDSLSSPAGPVMSAVIKTASEKQFQFTINTDSNEVTLNVVARMDDNSAAPFRSRFIFLGAKAVPYPSFMSMPVRRDQSIVWNWDRQLAGTEGMVDNGNYLIRVSAEGVDGAGYTEQSLTTNVRTKFQVKWGGATGDLGTSTPNAIQLAVDGNDVATVRFVANKSVRFGSVVKNADGRIIRVLASEELAHPVAQTDAHEIVWDGTYFNAGRSELVQEGTYTIETQIKPFDDTPTQTIKQQVRVTSLGRSVDRLEDWIDLDRLAPVTPINGNPVRLVTGNTYIKWRAKPYGKYYPPIDFQYVLSFENTTQRVTGYPYIPFVMVAHRWFDTVKIVPEVTLSTTFVKHVYHLFEGWKGVRDPQSHLIFANQTKLTDQSPRVDQTWTHTFSDDIDRFYGGKPDPYFENTMVVIQVKAPDGIVMDTIRIPVNQQPWPTDTREEIREIETKDPNDSRKTIKKTETVRFKKSLQQNKVRVWVNDYMAQGGDQCS
ncbi:hypothetical protein EBR96_06215, partial [bacterium]|nr:hypothetical protein [bacterium]